ncbi:hypothetical protein DQ135_25140 [Escherichia coli]|nr:hypothetical protein [Escherichia coli]
MLFLYYAVERKVVSKGLRSREMAAAGNFGGSVPERKRNTVLSQYCHSRFNSELSVFP